jgi:hypothetical protein
MSDEKPIDPELLHEAKHDPLLAYMIKHHIPLTREKWISMAWPDGKPDPWTADCEEQVPMVWRDHDED